MQPMRQQEPRRFPVNSPQRSQLGTTVGDGDQHLGSILGEDVVVVVPQPNREFERQEQIRLAVERFKREAADRREIARQAPVSSVDFGRPPVAVRIGQALFDMGGDVQRIQAGQELLRELELHNQMIGIEQHGISKVKAEAAAIRRRYGSLNPEQQNFYNQLERRRYELLIEDRTTIEILKRHFPNIAG